MNIPNSEKLEKDHNSEGIVMYAYNSVYDYVRVANLAAAFINRNLPTLPITIITDKAGVEGVDHTFINDIILYEGKDINTRAFRTTHDTGMTITEWKNTTRANVYDLTPYDKTLLLDCDYFMMNGSLRGLFDTDFDFSCFSKVRDATGSNSFAADERIGGYHSIPQLWATAIYFTKSLTAHAVFHMMKVIQENYLYYSIIHDFNPNPFRNDYALSIAMHILNGYDGFDNAFLMTAPLLSLDSRVEMTKMKNDGSLLYRYSTDKPMVGVIKDTNVHIMNKEAFENEEFYKGMMDYATS